VAERVTGGEVVIGTRGSALATWQAEWVRDALVAAHPDISVRLEVIRTSGDQRADWQGVSEQGLFTREIEQALLDGRISLAVHSLKDLPTQLPDGLVIAAVPKREDPSDALISKAGNLDSLPAGATVLAGSPRRRALVLRRRPDLVVEGIRGNVPTRLQKFDDSDAQAMILASAGLKRLGLADRITERLDPNQFVCACGQGALGIEIRADDDRTRQLVSDLDDKTSHLAVAAERAFQGAMGAGCRAPLGGYAVVGEDGATMMTGLVASADGREAVSDVMRSMVSDMADAEGLGRAMATRLMTRGAAPLVAAAREMES
jgi:hydroxymethylbilane synthase